MSLPVRVAIATRWELAPPIVEAMNALDDFDSATRRSPANYVRFANAVTKQIGIYVGDVDADATDALILIGRSMLELEENVLERLTADLPARAGAGA